MTFRAGFLELKQVRSVSLLKAEAGSKVLLEKGSLLDLTDKHLVDALLVLYSFGLDLLLGRFITKELLLGSRALGLLFSCKVSHVEFLNINRTNVDSSGSGNNVSSVYSSNRNTINLEGSRNQ